MAKAMAMAMVMVMVMVKAMVMALELGAVHQRWHPQDQHNMFHIHYDAFQGLNND